MELIRNNRALIRNAYSPISNARALHRDAQALRPHAYCLASIWQCSLTVPSYLAVHAIKRAGKALQSSHVAAVPRAGGEDAVASGQHHPADRGGGVPASFLHSGHGPGHTLLIQGEFQEGSPGDDKRADCAMSQRRSWFCIPIGQVTSAVT